MSDLWKLKEKKIKLNIDLAILPSYNTWQYKPGVAKT